VFAASIKFGSFEIKIDSAGVVQHNIMSNDMCFDD
jgi:hypothetical protein